MKLGRKLGADAGYAAMRLATMLVRWRGTGYALAFGRWAGRLVWLLGAVLGRRMRRSLANAEVALPDMPKAARRRILKDALVDAICYWPELANYILNVQRRVLENVEVVGREHLDAALARGKGVITPSIHLGNFTIIGLWMAQTGYRFSYLSRFPRDERIVRHMAWLKRLSGITLIRDLPRRKCAVDCLASLRRNEIIYFQLDQRAMNSKAGVFVDFFGKPFHAFSGSMSLAVKTGAALVPIYIVRVRGIRQRIVFEPELALERTGDRLADARSNLQSLMVRFEGWIREYPDQWWWLNRKWQGVG